MGTNQYIAPETYEGIYSPASDIFAAGVVGYWLLAGRPPFDPGIFDEAAGEHGARSPEMVEIQRKLKCAKVAWDDEDFGTGIESVASLLQSMLSNDPGMRPTATEALAHPFLGSESKKKSPAMDKLNLVVHDFFLSLLPSPANRVFSTASIG